MGLMLAVVLEPFDVAGVRVYGGGARCCCESWVFFVSRLLVGM